MREQKVSMEGGGMLESKRVYIVIIKYIII